MKGANTNIDLLLATETSQEKNPSASIFLANTNIDLLLATETVIDFPDMRLLYPLILI